MQMTDFLERVHGSVAFAEIDMGADVNQELEKEKFGSLAFYPALEIHRGGKAQIKGIVRKFWYSHYMLRVIYRTLGEPIAQFVQTYEDMDTIISSQTQVVVGVFDAGSEMHTIFEDVNTVFLVSLLSNSGASSL